MFELAVLIAATELQPALAARLADDVRELLTFSDVEALRALQAITGRKPGLVALEREFASTPRGKALANRLRVDPALSTVTIRQLSVDQTDDTELAAPVSEAAPRPAASTETAALQTAPFQATPLQTALQTGALQTGATAPPATDLDFVGTRRAQRHVIVEGMEVVVDGKPGTLVNLSLVGVQLVTTASLKPKQRVRVALTDSEGTIRSVATVVWATFEMPKSGGPRYRVGLDFVGPNAAALEAYIRRHERTPG